MQGSVKKLVVRGALISSSAAMSAFIGGLGLGGPASAATQHSIVCTTISGHTTANGLLLSGCSGDTEGSGFVSPLNPPGNNQATIQWANTDGTGMNIKVCIKEGCAHLDTGHESGHCPAHTTEREVVGTVTVDGTGSASVGGKVTGELCVDSAHNVSLEPGTTFII